MFLFLASFPPLQPSPACVSPAGGGGDCEAFRGTLAQLPLGLNASLLLMPQGHFFGRGPQQHVISFARTKETKQRRVVEDLSEKNSPSALFGLLRQVFPLNKKNSLRSNSFLFLTLQHSPPLHAQKVRPDLSAFFVQHRFARWGCGVCFFFLARWGGCLWCRGWKKSSWWNYFAVCVFVLNGNNCIFVPWEKNLENDMGALIMFGFVSLIAIVGGIYFYLEDKKEIHTH